MSRDNAKKNESAAPSETKWEFTGFSQSQIVKENGHFVTKFQVKWMTKEKTFEPMEELYHCPLMFEQFEKDQRKKLLAPLRKSKKNPDLTDPMANVPTIPFKILDTFNDKEEFLPKGSEIVMEILSERLKEGEMFWLVMFKGVQGFCLVRKCIMEYYFPFASAFFHMNMEHRRKNQAAVVAANAST